MKVSGWKELYPSIGLKPNHGFEFVRFVYTGGQDDYLALLRAIGVEEGDIAKEQRELNNPDPLSMFAARISKTSPDKVYPLLRYYLSEIATNSFAIGQKNRFISDTLGADFYIGFRNPKDTFIFLLKFPNATRVRMVRRDLSFYVRVAENDDKRVDGIDYFDEHNKVAWNKEDPQGFL